LTTFKINDSAPLMYPASNFSQAGLNGLGYLLGSMRDNIDEAKDKIKQIR
jgi:hypothetical protein